MLRNCSRLFMMAVLVIFAPGIVAWAGHGLPGAVYVASNAVQGNEVLVFGRTALGHLVPFGSYATGGLGTGSGLGNQSGLVLSKSERFLYVVNAGSDSVTAFRVMRRRLRLVGTYPSEGRQPISIALGGRFAYVLNAGGAVGDEDVVTGFHVRPDGSLEPIPSSTRSLSATSTGPAQVGFSPDGRYLVVTEKGTNTIDVFPVLDDGTLGVLLAQPSVGTTPFGFAFGKRNQLFVSEAFGGATDASTVSSYAFDDVGQLIVLDPSAPTTETAACWVVVSQDGRFAYTTNTGSASVSGFAIDFDGSLKLLDADGATGMTQAGPIDMDLSTNGRNLYVLNSGGQSISVFRVTAGGGLMSLGVVPGLPAGANGLAAR